MSLKTMHVIKLNFIFIAIEKHNKTIARILCYVRVRHKSKIGALTAENIILTSQLLNKISTKLQWQLLHLRGQCTQYDYSENAVLRCRGKS